MKLKVVAQVAALSAVAVLGAGLLASPAFAEGYVNTSDAPQIVAGQEVDGTAWLAGDTVSVAGTVKGDLFCAGNTVTITGVVEGDVVCAGNAVTVSGRVAGDVRLAGNSVTVSGGTGGAATVAGNNVAMTDGSTVGSDLTVGAGTLDLVGAVGRDVRMGGGVATLAGRVGRDVDAELENLTVSPSAAIGGRLYYVSANDASVAPGTVQGEVRRTDPPPQMTPTTPVTPARSVGGWLLGALASVAWLVLVSLAVVLLLPRFVRRVTDTTWSGVGKAALVGLVTLAAIIPIVILLFVTIVGSGAAILLVFGFPLALLLAGPLAAYFLGRQLLRGRTDNMVGMMAVGAALLGVGIVIPFVGFLVGLAAACVGLGFIVLSFRRQFTIPSYKAGPPASAEPPMLPAGSYSAAPAPRPDPPERPAPQPPRTDAGSGMA